MNIRTPTNVTPHWQRYRSVLLIVIALCTYTHVPLMSGGSLLVPSFPTVALAPLLLLTVRQNLPLTDVVFQLKIAAVLLLSIALSPGYAYIGEKFLGLAQFWMAIGVAVLIVRLMQQMRLDVLERALLALWCLIVAGAALEVLGVIRELSDTFRYWAYGTEYNIYDQDLRDMDLVGWPRPKFFSTEPSHVTKFFIASINSWLLVRVSWRKAAIVAGATLVMLLIMGSPMLIVSAAITLTILVWDQRARLGDKVMMILAVLLIGVSFGAYYGASTYSAATSRVAAVVNSPSSADSRPSSEERRMVFPYLTLVDTLSRSPLFGAGVGGKEVVAQHNVLQVANPKDALGNNALAEIGIFLGIVGGGCLIYLVLLQCRRTGVHRVGLMLVLIVLFSQLMGGIDTFRYWGFVALLWGALTIADAQADRAGGE